MKRKMKFCEWFWDKEYDGNTGFEVLLKRLKDGRTMCKDVEDFLRQRAKIEEEYASKLQKLVKSAGGNTENGSLKHSWDVVKLKTQSLAEEHSEVHGAFQDAANRVADFAERQKTQRKMEEDDMKKSIKRKHESFKKLIDTKRTYENKMKDLHQAEDALHSFKGIGTERDLKEQEKLQKKTQNSSLDAQKADQNYKTATDTLEAHRKQWEKDHIKMCEEFEKLEEDRIGWLRNEMWVHTNVVSQLCCDNDYHCEEMRKTLEKCDPDRDIEEFIEKNRIGDQKPGRIIYSPIKALDRPPAALPMSR